ncbi:MAG: GGDEF domain-containing protein [Treponema sp.]|nr:GGDEF domain-containing protein [Treponema sp.]
MKKIAVLVHNVSIDYSSTVLEGISDFFSDKNVQLIVCQTRQPGARENLFDYQFWSSIPLLFSKKIDGVIIVTGGYVSTISAEELSKVLRPYVIDIPFVSIGQPLDIPGSIYTSTTCDKAYNSIIKHLKLVHNCKKIAFMSANPTKSVEAETRFNAFKNAMKANDLEIDEDLIYDGFFTISSVRSEFQKKLKTKEDLKFDAIVAANDVMASGCQSYFEELGIRVPDDVKVVGFDNGRHAESSSPKLSTIDQQIKEQGVLAGKLIMEKLEGKPLSDNMVEAKPIFRQSCGCIPIQGFDGIYKDEKGNIIKENKKLIYDLHGAPLFFDNQLSRINSMFNTVTSTSTLQNFSHKFTYLMDLAEITQMAVVLYKEPEYLMPDDVFEVPEQNEVFIYRDNEKHISRYEQIAVSTDADSFIPENYFEELPGIYLFQPVYSGELNYGYIISRIFNANYSIYSIFTRIIVNGITQCYEYTRSILANEKLTARNEILLQNNESLSLESRTDELTKVLNRRGFMELGQRTVDIAVERKVYGLVLFVDLDNLKRINDNFGHEMGDEAIMGIAEILKETFRSSDLIGRLSGDEFAVVAMGFSMDLFDGFHAKIDRLCMGYAKQHNFEFPFSCSIGAEVISDDQPYLMDLLKSADANLYKEKRVKHGENK